MADTEPTVERWKFHWKIFVPVILLLALIIFQAYSPWAPLALIFKILDEYLRLILMSWPAVILIICLLLFLRHKEAIDSFISRIKSVGASGVDTFPIIKEQKESEPSTEALRNQVNQLQGAVMAQAKKTLFERIYSNIFGSQLNLLIRLNTTSAGITVVEATQYYMDAVVKYPGIRNYPFADYLNYLANVGLITVPEDWQTGRTFITEQGREFLTYIISEGLIFAKPL